MCVCVNLFQPDHNVGHLPVLWLTPGSFHAAGLEHLVALTQKSPLWIIIRKPLCPFCASWCFSAGVCLFMEECVYVWLIVWLALKVCFSPAGVLWEKWLCSVFRREDRGKDYPFEDEVGLQGWGTTTSSATNCSQDNNNQLQNWLKEQRILPEIPSGNSLTHAHTDVSLPACGVIVKMSFQ